MMLAAKGMRFPIDVILVCIRWYAAYPLSYRNLEEMMQERGVYVDHSSINRWAVRFLPLLEHAFCKHKRPVGGSWRMDETVDFLLTAKRDKAAALRFFEKAMKANGVPDKVAMDKSGANKAAMNEIDTSQDLPILVQQVKYLNRLVEQDHRAIQPVTRPMLNSKGVNSEWNSTAMSNFKDGWTAPDWQTVEDSSRDLLHFAHYLNERVGAGGGSITPDNIKANVLRAEMVLNSLKKTANNYY